MFRKLTIAVAVVVLALTGVAVPSAGAATTVATKKDWNGN